MSGDDSILLLTGPDVRALLDGRESEVVDAIRDAYVEYDRGSAYLPHSSFLYFPDIPRTRIIALPAYLGGDARIAGLKWVASFPRNLEVGIPRASAVVVLNSTETGRPLAMMEGSLISAGRTAASAALAARLLHGDGDAERVGLIGCGPINFETLRYLRCVFPQIGGLVLRDTDPARAKDFAERCGRECRGLEIEIVADADGVFGSAALVSIATTALTPHIHSLPELPGGSTILHLSVRDLATDVVLACDNVADDADHICREKTSLHLTEQLTGGREFIRCELADVILGRATNRDPAKRATVLHPFGLGVLDIALAQLVYEAAVRDGAGRMIPDFFPTV